MLADREAIFIAGRVAPDAPTVVRVGPIGWRGDLVLVYEGMISTPGRILRAVTIEQQVLGEVGVPGYLTPIRVYLTDLDEPDEIVVVIEEEPISSRVGDDVNVGWEPSGEASRGR